VVADRVLHLVKQLTVLLNELLKAKPAETKILRFLYNHINII